MISKELLSEVLKKEIIKIYSGKNILINDQFVDTDKELAFKYKCDNGSILDDIINIYELAYKCKEWANKQDYDNNCFVIILYENMTSRAIITEDGFGFDASTEYEAIFKVCQWILDNKGK